MYLQWLMRIETFYERYKRSLWIAFGCIAAIGVIANLFHLAALVFLQRIEDPAPPIYWEMGRAILNGLIPYEDIYETKPPGIFVLSALSLRIFGTPILGNIIHTILLLSIPILFILHTREQTRTTSPACRRSLMVFAFLGSSTLLRYLLPAPSGWLLDFHGAAWSILYLLVISNLESRTRTRIILATIALFIGIGIKETFILSTLAGALILLREKRGFLQGWVLPALCAVLAGVLALALTGWLHAFSSVYLPSMFGGYVQRFPLPWYQRGLAFDQVFRNLATLSPALDLLILSLFTFLLFPREKNAGERFTVVTSILLFLSLAFFLSLTAPGLTFKTSRWILGGSMVLCALFTCFAREKGVRFLLMLYLLPAGVLLLQSFQWCTDTSPLFLLARAVLSSSTHPNAPCIASSLLPLMFAFSPLPLLIRSGLTRDLRFLSFSASLLLGAIALLYVGIVLQAMHIPLPRFAFLIPLVVVGGSSAYFLFRRTLEQWHAFFRVARLALAFFLAFTAVAMAGDFQNQHFMSAVPLYAAAFLAALRIISQHFDRPLSSLVLFLLTIFLKLISLSPYHDYSTLLLRNYPKFIAEARNNVALAKESAQRIDTILDRCGVERYFIVKLGESDFNPFHGFTRHSPLNFFYWAGLEDINRYHPLVSEREIRNFNKAQIVVAGDQPTEPTKPLEQSIKTFLEQEFTQEPWPCAAGLPTPEKRTMLYRRLRTNTE